MQQLSEQNTEALLKKYFWQLLLNNCECLNGTHKDSMTPVDGEEKINEFLQTGSLSIPSSHLTKNEAEDFYRLIMENDLNEYRNSIGRKNYTYHAEQYILYPSTPDWVDSMKKLRRKFDIKEHYQLVEEIGNFLYKEENGYLLAKCMAFGLITAIYRGGKALSWFIDQIFDDYPPHQVMQCSTLMSIATIPWIKVLTNPEQHLYPINLKKRHLRVVKGFGK